MRKIVTAGIVAGLLLVAVAALAVMTSMRSQPPKKERVKLDPLVEVLELKAMDAQFEIRSQGTVRPRTETTLSAEVSGTITYISPRFTAGGIFAAGDRLLRIDPTNYDVAVKQAEALVAQRQIEFDGTEKLRAQGYRAETEFASAKAALATARAELVRANRNLQRTSIRLPYEGIVRNKHTDLGEFVNTGTQLGVVFATNVAEIRLPLTDNDLAYVDLPETTDRSGAAKDSGPEVTLSATQKGSRAEWNARIVRTEGVVDEKSRVTYAVARVDDPYQLHGDGQPLPMGTFVSAVIQGKLAENVVQIPRGVVRGSDQLLFVNDDNKIQIESVGIVRSDTDYIYVRSDEASGKRVVLTVLETPVNGMAVRPVKIGEEL